MNKKIFVINGRGGTGKDLFVKLVSELVPTLNVSSVDKVKQIAKEIGWNGKSKTEKDREFLCYLKSLTTNYYDMPFKDMEQKVKEFKQDNNQCLFLHIREPEEIERAVKKFNAETILIKRPNIKQIISNPADANVNLYDYDYTISNEGTIDDLKLKAKHFVENHINDNKAKQNFVQLPITSEELLNALKVLEDFDNMLKDIIKLMEE